MYDYDSYNDLPLINEEDKEFGKKKIKTENMISD